MDAGAWAGLASVIVALIAAGSAIASQRAAAKASVKNTDTTSRADIEKDAFERAEKFYTNALDRASQQIEELEGDVSRLRGEVQSLTAELDLARRTLGLRFPDEP